MTEIEISKMYENVGIEKDWKPLPYGDIEEYYPDFTTEKQLRLIKWLCRTGHCLLRVVQYTDTNNWYMQTLENISSTAESFEECLARLISNLWQSLNNQEKEEIRRILNE